MIAAGSGIAPMYQLTQTVVDSGNDLTSLSLIYSNRTPFDMILDEDLSEFDKMGKLSYLPVVQNPDENWHMAKGRITKQMIENFMPLDYDDKAEQGDSIIMVCGPPALKDSVAQITQEMGLANTYFFN